MIQLHTNSLPILFKHLDGIIELLINKIFNCLEKNYNITNLMHSYSQYELYKSCPDPILSFEEDKNDFIESKFTNFIDEILNLLNITKELKVEVINFNIATKNNIFYDLYDIIKILFNQHVGYNYFNIEHLENI